MNSFLRIKLILFLCCMGYFSWSQIAVSGIIYDEKRNPKEAVEIQIEDTNLNERADASGRYRLEVTEKGIYKLIAFAYGYQIYEKVIQTSTQWEGSERLMFVVGATKASALMSNFFNIFG